MYEGIDKYSECIRDEVCNTLVLSMHLALAFHEHKHHQSIHEHEHMEFHLILYILSHVMLLIYLHMLVIMCDQCEKMVVGPQKHLRHI